MPLKPSRQARALSIKDGGMEFTDETENSAVTPRDIKIQILDEKKEGS